MWFFDTCGDGKEITWNPVRSYISLDNSIRGRLNFTGFRAFSVWSALLVVSGGCGRGSASSYVRILGHGFVEHDEHGYDECDTPEEAGWHEECKSSSFSEPDDARDTPLTSDEQRGDGGSKVAGNSDCGYGEAHDDCED